MTLKNKPSKYLAIVSGIAIGMMLPACTAVYDDFEECPSGVKLRFVFDHNLEFANAFPQQVDCLSVYVFDADGQLVKRQVETSDALADENWRLDIGLPAGSYTAVAYGGLDCDLASFSLTRLPEEITHHTHLSSTLNAGHTGDTESRPARPLHDFYYGSAQFEVEDSFALSEATVKMMRNTNHIRVVLQHLDYSPVDPADFTFEITDDNSLLSHTNEVVPSGEVTYTPWATGQNQAGNVTTAYAELSTSRLIDRSLFQWPDADGSSQKGPRLKIAARESGNTVADLPLNDYLLMLKSDFFASMSNQEWLDRASRYNLIFFLDRQNRWGRMHIVVDDWTVRINNITLE